MQIQRQTQIQMQIKGYHTSRLCCIVKVCHQCIVGRANPSRWRRIWKTWIGITRRQCCTSKCLSKKIQIHNKLNQSNTNHRPHFAKKYQLDGKTHWQYIPYHWQCSSWKRLSHCTRVTRSGNVPQCVCCIQVRHP